MQSPVGILRSKEMNEYLKLMLPVVLWVSQYVLLVSSAIIWKLGAVRLKEKSHFWLQPWQMIPFKLQSRQILIILSSTDQDPLKGGFELWI